MKQFQNMDDIPQTMSLSYQEICEGTDPWISLGAFVNDFFGNYPDQREALVKDPINEPVSTDPALHHWATFCAASVEFLCQKYSISCPSWVNTFASLPEPWYHYPVKDKPQVRESLVQKTPEPFARRNIFCGDRVFNNKYEALKDFQGKVRRHEESQG